MNVFDLMARLAIDSKDYVDGLTKAEGEANNFGSKWDSATSKMKKGFGDIATGVGVFAGLGTAAFASANKMSQNLDQIDKMSQKLGMSTKAYQEWDYVMKISGADINSMGAGIKTLTNKLDEAKSGTASAVESFEKLGLSMEQVEGMSREDLFSAVITQLQGMGDTADRAALANDLLGRSAMELGPLFNTTAEDTQALIDQVNEMGGVIGEDAVKNGANFQDSLTGLQTAFKGASASLFEKLIPAVTKFMDKISEFIESGGLDTIIGLLQTLVPILTAVAAGFASFKIITGVITLIQGMSEAFGILNAVMAANPIGLVIAAIAALIAIFVLAYQKSETFREGVNAAFNKVKEGVINAVEKVKAVVKWFQDLPGNALQWGKDLIDNFKKGLLRKKDDLENGLKGMAKKVKDFLGFSEPKMGPLHDFHTYSPDMVDLFIEGMNKSMPKLENATDKMASVVSEGMTTADAMPVKAQTTTDNSAAIVGLLNSLVGSMTRTEHTTIIELDGRQIAKAVDQPLREIDRQRGLSLAGGETW